MPDTLKHSAFEKIRYTPARDFFRSGLTASLDWRRPLEESSLPVPIKQLIERVVRKTRLWRQEKLDVLTELIGHFTDGLAAGVSSEELIRVFGGEAAAAKLIRSAKRRNRPLYWRALHAAVVFTLVVGIPLLLLSAYLQRVRWDAMNQRVHELTSNTGVRADKRTVLRETILAGNAWDDYLIALGDSKPWGDHAGNFYMYAAGNLDDAKAEAETEKSIADNVWRLDYLRRGAARDDGRFNEEKARDLPLLLPSRMLANLGVAQAKRLADRGRSHEAADVLLDLTAFAKDLSSHRQILYTVVGDAIYLTAFEELRRLLVAGKFNAAQMTKLSSSLEIIDRELPRLDAMASKVVTGAGLRLIAKSNRRLGDAYWWSDSKELGWRFSISPRGYAIDAFFQIDPYLQRIAKLEDLPYATAKAEAEAMTAEAKKSTNEYVRDALPDFSRVIDAQREVRALLRLVRAATALLLTGEVPMMSDPFGTNLLSRRNAHSITIWSLGRDGTNQNGRDDYGQPDIAIEIPR